MINDFVCRWWNMGTKKGNKKGNFFAINLHKLKTSLKLQKLLRINKISDYNSYPFCSYVAFLSFDFYPDVSEWDFPLPDLDLVDFPYYLSDLTNLHWEPHPFCSRLSIGVCGFEDCWIRICERCFPKCGLNLQKFRRSRLWLVFETISIQNHL